MLIICWTWLLLCWDLTIVSCRWTVICWIFCSLIFFCASISWDLNLNQNQFVVTILNNVAFLLFRKNFDNLFLPKDENSQIASFQFVLVALCLSGVVWLCEICHSMHSCSSAVPSRTSLVDVLLSTSCLTATDYLK